MLPRARHIERVERLIRRHPVVAIIGARQVGKSTLARQIARRHKTGFHYFDLEDPIDLGRLEEPGLALRSLRGLIVLDEIQRHPEIFSILRVLADRPRSGARFLVLGSASPELLRQSSETLAGRISYFVLDGFNLSEVGSKKLDQLWLRGGFPRAFAAHTQRESLEWRQDFVTTFLERDLPGFGVNVPSTTMRRFWTMLAHHHGQTWNASEFGRSFAAADTTVRRYLDVLVSTFVVRQLQPWKENVRKRQVKAPKTYIADSGLLHALLNLPSRRDLESHPKLGASWEGFLLSHVIQRLELRSDEVFYWATHSGAELDLLVVRGRKRLGFEFKRTEAPKVTKSMRIAMEDLGLTRLSVVHAGPQSFPLGPQVRALAACQIVDELAPLR